MTLSEQQKKDLLSLIEFAIGVDPSITSVKSQFNSATVDVVERMIEASIECNSSMKKLVVDVVSGGKVQSRGWLKHSLSAVKFAISRSELNGYGCMVGTKANWKRAIITSV